MDDAVLRWLIRDALPPLRFARFFGIGDLPAEESSAFIKSVSVIAETGNSVTGQSSCVLELPHPILQPCNVKNS